jgi:hypothetical protein
VPAPAVLHRAVQAREVPGLSTGAGDQLYLALRIAAVEEYLAHGIPLPFVADDLFVSYDDERAAAGFRVLAQLAQKTQVLFFTHHPHTSALALFGNTVRIRHRCAGLCAGCTRHEGGQILLFRKRLMRRDRVLRHRRHTGTRPRTSEASEGAEMNLAAELPPAPECFGEIVAECRDALAALERREPPRALSSKQLPTNQGDTDNAKSTSPTKFIQKIMGCALRTISRLPRARNEPSRNIRNT